MESLDNMFEFCPRENASVMMKHAILGSTDDDTCILVEGPRGG